MDSAHLSLRTLFCGIRYNFDKLERAPPCLLSPQPHSPLIVRWSSEVWLCQAISGSLATRARFLISRSVSTRSLGSADLSLILRTHWLSSLFHWRQKAPCRGGNLFFVYSVEATKLTFEINCKWVRVVFYLCPEPGVRMSACTRRECACACACTPRPHSHHTPKCLSALVLPSLFRGGVFLRWIELRNDSPFSPSSSIPFQLLGEGLLNINIL